jgi:hypothetical protein
MTLMNSMALMMTARAIRGAFGSEYLAVAAADGGTR